VLNLLRFGESADYSGFPEVAPVGASRVQRIRGLLLTRVASCRELTGADDRPRPGAERSGKRVEAPTFDREDQSRLVVVHFRRDKARCSWIGQLRLVSSLAARLRPSMRAPVVVWGWWDDPGAKVTYVPAGYVASPSMTSPSST
jgi:hypothetical protein